MAELSDADKRVLLGENYKEIERAAAEASGMNATQEAIEEKRKKIDNVRTSAGVIGLLGTLVFVTNYLQMSGPYQPYMSIAAAIGAVGGIVCAVMAHMKLQSV